MANEALIRKRYDLAREQYAEAGVDTGTALRALSSVSLSLHCWQGDDVAGFENPEGGLTGGIQATGVARTGFARLEAATTDLAEALVGGDWGRHQSIRQRSLDALNRFAHQVRSIPALVSS